MRRLAVLISLLLSGCASLSNFTQKHPVVTAIGAAVIVGSIAASVDHGGHKAVPHCHQDPTPINCRPIS